MLRSSFSHSFLEAFSLAYLHLFPIERAWGNGLSSGCFERYCRSISAVAGLSLYDPLVCPFTPLMFIVPRSALIIFRVVFASSAPSAPVSHSTLKIVAESVFAWLMIFSTCEVEGMRGMVGGF